MELQFYAPKEQFLFGYHFIDYQSTSAETSLSKIKITLQSECKSHNEPTSSHAIDNFWVLKVNQY